MWRRSVLGSISEDDIDDSTNPNTRIHPGCPDKKLATQNEEDVTAWKYTSASKDVTGSKTELWNTPCMEQWDDFNDINGEIMYKYARTGKSVASKAGKALSNSSSKSTRSIAGSALSQRRKSKKR